MMASLKERDGLKIARIAVKDLEVIRALNWQIFAEERVINNFNRHSLTMLAAFVGERPVGFKIGYAESPGIFYSAKGGVIKEMRRRGIATALLEKMIDIARQDGFHTFSFHTYPSKYPEMTSLAEKTGFRAVSSEFDPYYRDVRVRYQLAL